MQDVVGTFPIQLDGKQYYIDIGSWKARDVTDFSPKTTVPGTGAVFGDLQLYQPIAFNNWQHGFGYIWHEDEAGYLETEGNVDTRHRGAVMLSTEAVASDTNADSAFIKEGGITYGGDFYTWGDAGVRRFETAAGTWSGINVQRPVFDSASEGSATGLADLGTLTISHTVTTEGTDRYLLVCVLVDDIVTDFTDADGIEGTGSPGITVTYNAVNVPVITGSGGANTHGIVAFGLADPATGANDCVVTVNTNGGTTEVVALVESFIYVNQSTPLDTLQETTGTGTTATDDGAGASRELIVDFVGKAGTEAGDSASAATGQTEIAQDDEATGTDIHLMSSYMFASSGDATPTMTWTWTNSRAWLMLLFALNPIAEVPADWLFENGEYLIVSPQNGRILRSSGGTADYVPAGLNNKSNDFSWMEMHGGYIFAGKTAEAEVYFDSNSDLSALAGDPADDSDELVAGPGATGTKSGISFLEKLVVPRNDGLWTMDTDDANTSNWISKRTLNFRNLSSSVNFRTIATHGGSLFFSIQDKILFEWNGAKLQNITPRRFTLDWEYAQYYRFDNLTPFGDWLLFTARTSQTLSGNTGYTESIIAWDGVGYHKLADPITDGDGTISMLAIDPENNYIWYHVNKPTASTNNTYYIEFQADTDLPYANFPTSGTNRLTTSRIHGGFRRVDKSMPALWMETDNLNSTQTILVEYAIDNSSTWYTWDTLTTNGEHLLTLPSNKLTEEFKYIRLRFTLSTASATETPVLEGYALMVMMRPDFKMGYSFEVIGGSNVSSGMFEDSRTGESIMKDIRRARDKKDPISLVTPFGDEVYGYVTSITEQALEWEPDDYMGGHINILQMIQVNFVESLAVEGTEEDVEPTW